MKPLTNMFLRACTDAAVACHPWIGKGEKVSADAAAVEAMRSVFNNYQFTGRIVIGEGERDEAPMLFIGEQVGQAQEDGERIDIAVDPLEGTSLCARAAPGAICVAAFAPAGQLLHAPDVYMEKLAVGPKCSLEVSDLDDDIISVAHRVADQLNKPLQELKACLLNRPRHEDMITRLQGAGVQLSLIDDGDVIGALRCALDPEHDAAVDLYVGTGGAPEGVLAATGLSALGGKMLGKLVFSNQQQRDRAQEMGLSNVNQVFTETQMAGSNGVLVATGVTDGDILDAITKIDNVYHTHSMIISKQGIDFQRGHTF